MGDHMKIVTEFALKATDPVVTKAITTTSNDPVVVGKQLITYPGVGPGKRFVAFASIPSGTIVGCDFDTVEAPVVTTDAAANAQAVSNMLANPPSYDILVYNVPASTS
jgi:hypothetical protein